VALAEALDAEGVPVFTTAEGFTHSHQFALEAQRFGGGQTAAKRLRQSNILTCGIGLPLAPVPNDLNGLRFGTPEIVRWGMKPEHMPQVAGYIADVLLEREALEKISQAVSAYRREFQVLFIVCCSLFSLLRTVNRKR